MSTLTEADEVLAELRQAGKLLLTTHENPDGDALGSLLAMHEILRLLGKDSKMFMAANQFPLPPEYHHLPFEEVTHEPPADIDERTVVFLDCGNIDRMPVDFLQRTDAEKLNIDHHHDNTLFGTANLVDVEASCTAEIVHSLAKLLGATVTPSMATALYVGLVTDTGKFMYENTDADAHHMAAELIEAGVDVDDIYRRLYERVPMEKTRLVARALAKVERYDSDQIALTYISADDYERTGASELHTEGIIDHVRALEGTRVAGVIRDKTDGGRWARKVSLRSTDGAVDVSAIAREHGGGGHRRAAGFGTDIPHAELVDYIRAAASV
ncbi:MAG: bifunctional oligoribonuclease/PAP phosphatase NrnA, partial [Actinomycetota bacterium]|nr:bifunctional oligoribonuclease/PAP phosphatase NrnA [Actinomycetota bacterium]